MSRTGEMRMTEIEDMRRSHQYQKYGGRVGKSAQRHARRNSFNASEDAETDHPRNHRNRYDLRGSV